MISGGAGNDQLFGGNGDDVLAGDAGDDQLYGGLGDDLLHGDQGDDQLYGGGGDDTYIYGRGDGHDTIHDHHEVQVEVEIAEPYEHSHQTSGKTATWVTETRYRYRTELQVQQRDGGEDTLQFGNYIAVADLFLETSAQNMVIGIRSLGEDGSSNTLDLMSDTVTIQDWQNEFNRVEIFEFVDGLVLDMRDITNAVSSHDGNDILAGTIASDYLSSGLGDDQVSGGAGDDILVGGRGADTLHGEGGRDRLFAGDDADVLTGGAGEDDLFGGAGDDELTGGADKDYLVGNAGNDLLLGGEGDDVLTGGVGNDTLMGGAGNDVYIFNRGDGHDEIHDYAEGQYQEQYEYVEQVSVPGGKYTPGYTINETRLGWRTAFGQLNGGEDTLQFGESISIDDLFITMDAGNMIVAVEDLTGAFNEDYYLASNPEIAAAVEAGTFASGLHHYLIEGQAAGLAGNDPATFEDQVTIVDWTNPDSRLEWFRFTNNIAVDMSQIATAQSGGDSDDNLVATAAGGGWLAGGLGNDTLTGGGGDDILFGGDGDDRTIGGDGNDTYVFGRDAGADTIVDTAGDDVILYTEGIVLDDLRLELSGDNLSIGILEDASSGDEIIASTTVENWTNTESRVELLQFSNGRDFDLGRLGSFITANDANGQTLTGTGAADWIDGHVGSDIVTGGAGDDVIMGRAGDDSINGGQGNDLIFGGSGDDTITDAGCRNSHSPVNRQP